MSAESPRAEMKGQTSPSGAEKSQAELREALHEKFKSAKALFDASLADFKQALKDGAFEDKEGEAPGTGEAGRQAFEKKVRGHLERATRLSDALKSNEPVTEEMLKGFEDRPHVDYAAFAADVDPSKAGEEWNLNAESDHPDFEAAKPFVPDLSAYEGKALYEVFQYVLDTYGSTHYIAGKEYLDYIRANPDKTPASLQNKRTGFYFPGSFVRDENGAWRVLYADWGGSSWCGDAHGLRLTRDSFFRVVLLEK